MTIAAWSASTLSRRAVKEIALSNALGCLVARMAVHPDIVKAANTYGGTVSWLVYSALHVIAMRAAERLDASVYHLIRRRLVGDIVWADEDERGKAAYLILHELFDDDLTSPGAYETVERFVLEIVAAELPKLAHFPGGAKYLHCKRENG